MLTTPQNTPVLAGNTGGRQAARVRSAGFTLIELSVVAVLLGLMLVVVMVAAGVAFRDSEELKSEARELAGTLEMVRTLAILRGETHTVQYNLDFDNQGYFVWMPVNSEGASGGELIEETDHGYRVAAGFHRMPSRFKADRTRLYSTWIDRIAFGDGTETTDAEVRVDFRARGGSHWHYVYLTNLNDEFYTVEINPFTGVADIYPGELIPDPPEVLR